MARLPVRPGHLRQRGAHMPVLPAGLAAAFLPHRPRPRRRLVKPLAGRRPGGIPRRLPQPRLKLSDPLPALRQLLQRPRQRSLRLRQLPAQRGHQRGQRLIPGTSVITRHTRTLLPPKITCHYSRTLSGNPARWCGTCGQPPRPHVGDLWPSRGVPRLTVTFPERSGRSVALRGGEAQPEGGQAPVTAGTAGRRSRMAAPAAAAWSLGVLIVLLCAALVPLAVAAREAESDIAVVIIMMSLALVGIVVARRQPGNPLGWMFLALAALAALGNCAGAYAVLSYRLGHHLPLGVPAVFLALYWCPLIVAFPLMILLFPDGRLPSPRWRPVLWAYLTVGACWPVSVYAVAAGAVAAGDLRILPGGDLQAVDHPAGSSA